MQSLTKTTTKIPTNQDAPRLTILKTIESMSEETPCFQARLDWQGMSWEISNDGHGGSNRNYPHLHQHNREMLDQWAATNCKPIPAAYGLPEAPMDWETFTFQCAFDFLEYVKPLHSFCRQHGVKFPLLHSDVDGLYMATKGTLQLTARKELLGYIFSLTDTKRTNPLIAQQLVRFA